MTREMKDSGIGWIMKIPENWETRRIRKLATIRTGNTPSKADGNTNFSNISGIPWIKAENLENFEPIRTTEEYLTKDGEKLGKVFKPHTIFVGCIASVGKVGYSDIPCSCNQQINNVDFKNNIIAWKYGFYALKASSPEHLAKANQSVQLILNAQSEGYISLPLPPLSEQQSIANYLDAKCSKIDEAVSRQKAIVEKLKEYRQSIITEAVTHGLNPDAEMKDSGIPEFSKLNEYYSAKKLKYLFSNEENYLKVGPFGSALPSSEFIGQGKWIYTQRTVLDNNFSSNNTFISEKLFNNLISFSVFPKDILITTRGTLGKIAIVPNNAEKGILHPCLIRFRIDRNLIIDTYLKYIFNETKLIIDQIKRMNNSTTIDALYSYHLKEVFLPVPPIEEQQQIVDYLDNKCSKIDEAISRSNAIIEKLEEYKKSIIYEYVTGKKEVPSEYRKV